MHGGVYQSLGPNERDRCRRDGRPGDGNTFVRPPCAIRANGKISDRSAFDPEPGGCYDECFHPQIKHLAIRFRGQGGVVMR